MPFYGSRNGSTVSSISTANSRIGGVLVSDYVGDSMLLISIPDRKFRGGKQIATVYNATSFCDDSYDIDIKWLVLY